MFVLPVRPPDLQKRRRYHLFRVILDSCLRLACICSLVIIDRLLQSIRQQELRNRAKVNKLPSGSQLTRYKICDFRKSTNYFAFFSSVSALFDSNSAPFVSPIFRMTSANLRWTLGRLGARVTAS